MRTSDLLASRRLSVGGLFWALTLVFSPSCAPLVPPGGSFPAGNPASQAYRGFDPYPEDRTAPAIEGARPPGFEHPVSEPQRVRQKPWLSER